MTELTKALKSFGSREVLAHELGVTAPTVWRWQHGQEIPLPALRLMRRLMEEKAAKVSRTGADTT